jgi:multidrug resistance efflux pump
VVSRTYGRRQRLYTTGARTQADRDSAQASYDEAVAQLGAARAQGR